MILTVFGAGPAYTDREGASGAAYLVSEGSTRMLLDLGHGSFQRIFREAPPEDIAAVVVSHLHPDHFIDLVPLRHYLRYHLVPKRISTKDVATGIVTTMEGSPLTLKASSGLPTVNDLTVIKGARATNGTVLVVGTVLLPPDLKVPTSG